MGLLGFAVLAMDGAHVACAPRLRPTATPVTKASAAQHEEQGQPGSSVMMPTPKVSPAPYAEATKKRKHIQSSSSRAIPPKRPTAKGSIRQAVARRMALIPWQVPQEDVSARPASCKEEPGSLSRDTLQETQLKGWVSRVLQAALLDTTKLNALLTEAAQYKMFSMLLRVTGPGPALATA